MKVTAIKCNKCNSTVFSRTRHDMHWCKCRKCAIDGGFDYVSITGNPEDYQVVELDVTNTKEELYDDWNSGSDKLGLF